MSQSFFSFSLFVSGGLWAERGRRSTATAIRVRRRFVVIVYVAAGL
jgi:hypothetical protein